jgi:hypothetical protein
MADILNEIFADDDSEADFQFEGFGPEDLVEINGNDIPTFEIPHLDDDDELPIDIRAGWKRDIVDNVEHAFTGNSGVNIRPNDLNPYSFFKLFISENDFENISLETNRYFLQSYDDKNLA